MNPVPDTSDGVEVTVPTASEHMFAASSPKKLSELHQIHERKYRKGKRRLGKSNEVLPSGDAAFKSVPSAVTLSSKPKARDRRHKNQKGTMRQVKKGGAGERTVWGKPGDELYAEKLYDSDEYEEEVTFEVLSPRSQDTENQNFYDILQEYFVHCDPAEASDALMDLEFAEGKHMVPKLAMEQAMERKYVECELVSMLVAHLCVNGFLYARHVEKGFELLLDELTDLVLDIPDAVCMAGMFLARATADDCCPPSFIASHLKTKTGEAWEALNKAHTLLNMSHAMARLDNIWGLTGGIRPLKVLVAKIEELLCEYLTSQDTSEAVRCIQDLDVPHFHHQLVYEAVVLVLEKERSQVTQLMVKLLQHLAETALVTWDQLNMGLQRVFDSLADLVLDTPHAYQTLGDFVNQCIEAGFVQRCILEKVPDRGRKRYVSEGDGGLIKA